MSLRRAAWFLLAAGLAWGQGRYGSIVGAVVDDRTGAPVARAVVTLRTDGADPLEAVDWANDRGGFSFSAVPPGKYFLTAQYGGYQLARFGAVSDDQPPEVLTLAPGEQRRVVMRMRPVGSISGTVTGPDGEPAPGVNVRLLTQGFDRRKVRYFASHGATTDSHGEYHMGGVPAGKYLLAATPQPGQQAPAPSEVTAGQPPIETRYAEQFYPGADRLSAAMPIELAPGKDLEDLDFELSPRWTSAIEGTVLLPPDVPPEASLFVQVTPEEDSVDNFQTYGAAIDRQTGAFEVKSVLSGRYRVTALLSLKDRTYRGIERVEVGESPANVTVRLVPGVQIAGTVRLEGGPAGEKPQFQVWLVAGDRFPMAGPSPNAEVKPDGTFVLANVLPGVWDIGVQPIPQGGYIKSMRLGEQDVLTEDMVIGPQTSAPLNIVLSARGAVVGGRVTQEGAAKVKAYVLLAPAGRFENVWAFYQVVPADESGHFEFTAVTPGSYRVYAIDRMETNPSQDPGFLKRLGGQGEPVEAVEGGRATVELRLGAK